MKINTLQLNENFDFELDGNGMLPVSFGDKSTLETSAFTISNNDDWIYRKDLGMHWIDRKGNGLLQSKGNEEKIVHSIINKLNENPLISSVRLLEIKQENNKNRNLQIKLTLTINEKEEFLEFTV